MLLSCGEDNPSTPGDGGPYPDDNVVCDIEYRDDAMIVESSALLTCDTVNPESAFDEKIINLTVDKELFGPPPMAGDVFFIKGYGTRKVISVDDHGSFMIIESEFAALTEAVKNANISWDFTPVIEEPGIINVEGVDHRPVRISTEGYEYSFEWGNNKYTLWFNPKGTSENGLPEMQVNFIVENKIDADGKVTATYGAKGTTRLPHISADIDIQDSELTGFTTNNSGYHSEFTLEYIATFSPGSEGTQILTMPNITLKVPLQSLTAIPIPIPIYINFGLGFQTYLNLPQVQAFCNAKVKMIMDSKTGFEFKGPSVGFNYKVGKKDLGDCTFEVGDLSLCPTGIEMKWEVLCPRIALNVMGQEVCWIAPIFGSRTKLIVPSLCKAQMTQVRLEGGYGFKIFGNSIAEGKKVFFNADKTYKSPECP